MVGGSTRRETKSNICQTYITTENTSDKRNCYPEDIDLKWMVQQLQRPESEMPLDRYQQTSFRLESTVMQLHICTEYKFRLRLCQFQELIGNNEEISGNSNIRKAVSQIFFPLLETNNIYLCCPNYYGNLHCQVTKHPHLQCTLLCFI